MDIDMLRKGRADQESLVALVKDCATLEVEADGLTFLADSVVSEPITQEAGCISFARRRTTGKCSVCLILPCLFHF